MRLILMTAAMLTAGPVLAQVTEGQRAQLTVALADLIASEKMCGQNFDEDAINGWIDANIPPRDEKFQAVLNASIAARKNTYEAKSLQELAKQCVAVIETATALGFVK